MRITSSKCILFIEPSSKVSQDPLIDDLTMRMTCALRSCVDYGTIVPNGNFHSGISTKGIHECSCGKAESSSRDFLVVDRNGNEIGTNTLCIHYLAYHRDEIDQAELDKVRSLPDSPPNELPPNEHELRGSFCASHLKM